MSPQKCTPAEVIALLREEILPELPAEAPDDTDLFEQGLDSLAVMQLIVAMGERWGVQFGAADVRREVFGSPAALAAAISERL